MELMKNMSQKSQLVKNTIIIAIGKISTQILSYILLPLFTARMAVEQYGTYDLGCTLSLFLCPIITLLMEESMFRFLIDAKNIREKRKIISQTIIYTLVGTLIFVPLAILVFSSTKKYPSSFAFAFIVFVISNIFINLSNALARGLSQIKIFSISNFILGITTIILTIVALLVFPNAEGLLWANSIANLATSLIVFKKLKFKEYFGTYNKKIMREMISYSIPLVPNSISWTIINMSDRIILTNFIDSTANGIYAMANKFPNIINVLYGYFYTAWKESAAKILKQENKDAYYNSIYHDIKRFLFAVTLSLIAVMPFAFPIFINEKYSEAYIYIPIIMLATYYSNISSFYGGIFSAYKDTKIMGTTTFIAASINLIIDLIFVSKFKIYAACFSTLIADIIIYYYRRQRLKRFLKLKELTVFGPIIMMTIICFAYYSKYIPGISNAGYWIINVISLIIAITYSYAINKKNITVIIGKLKNRVRKN